MTEIKRGWVYADLGDYHRNVDPNWSYTPTYLRKRHKVREFMARVPKSDLVIDAGCGEGVVVEEFVEKGYNIIGVDANYEGASVLRGDVRNLQFADASAGAMLLLDVFEHLHFSDQPVALSEIHRVLKPGGLFLASIPNLAHFNCRVRLALVGRLDRSDSELNHVGERPLAENLALLRGSGFEIERLTGITFTAPYLYRRVVCRNPARYRWLHDAMEPLAAAMPSLAMTNLIQCRKPA